MMLVAEARTGQPVLMTPELQSVQERRYTSFCQRLLLEETLRKVPQKQQLPLWIVSP